MTDPQDITLTDGSPVPEDGGHREIDLSTGMQKGYVVLSDAERAKGFIRPVRRAYVHVGPPGPQHPLADLTPEQLERFRSQGWAKYEKYPDSDSPSIGRFWTQAELDRVEKPCGTVTTMSMALAETYAREPGFYGGTFCAGCGTHYPVGRGGEFVWQGTDEKVGT